MRDKTKVAVLVGKGEPFVYTSGRYPSEYDKTTIAVQVTSQPDRDAGLVYDLRINPDEFIKLAPAQLASLWQLHGPDAPYFPIKKLSYNRSPAVAPRNVLDDQSTARLKLDLKEVDNNLAKLTAAEDFGNKLLAALEIIEPPRQPQLIVDEQTVESQLYEGFIKGPDKTKIGVVRATPTDELASLKLDFEDERLKVLLPLYKARNFPNILTREEKTWWQNFKHRRLIERGALDQHLARIDELTNWPGQSPENKNLLNELKSYTESLTTKT
jgi:exodeoxyribonuclease-1